MTLSFASRTLRCLAALALLSTVDWAHAQRLRPGQTLTSRSRQFVVSSLVDATFVAAPNKVKAVPDRVQLHPSGLAQFAESIRDQWVKRFGIASRWQGQIHLQIIPGKLGDPARFGRIPNATGSWDYRASVPQLMPGLELTELIVDLLFTEFAGRYSSTDPVLPTWITPGTTELILQSKGPILFTPFAPQAVGGLNFTHPQDPLHASREFIQNSKPISYLNLTLPPPPLKGAEDPVYRAHAHLLVHKLIELSKGPERIQFFLRELPKHKNSARAFGVAFGHESMLKIEQWWSMAQIQFRSRDAFHRWRPEVILVHLSDCLQIETELPPDSPQAKPKTQRIPLQTYLRTDPTPQERALKLTPVLQRLAFLQVNSTPETARIIQDYRETLGAYLGLRSSKIHRAIRTKPTAQAALRDRAIAKLSLLDTILADMNPDKPETHAKFSTP